MGDLIVGAIILCVVGGAIYSLYRARKRGAACMGCPGSGQCTCKCKKGKRS